ncbi:MAG: metallophosphoesterase [Methylocystaceae bacterium]|nr:metallophosphoesterase [Methylocystaceae bacterium]
MAGIKSIVGLMCLGLASCTMLPAEQTFKKSPHYASGELDTSIIFLADNQSALLDSFPIVEQSSFSEKTVGTAHRRAALDMFSLDIVEYIAAKEGDLIIHAGDLLNNSCQSEFDVASKVMNESGKPWYMAPGNHDGYYLGISAPQEAKNEGFFGAPLNELTGWLQVCTPARSKESHIGFKTLDPRYMKNKMDKYEFVQAYIRQKDFHNYWPASQDENSAVVGDRKIKCISNLPENGDNIKFLKKACWSELAVPSKRNTYNDGKFLDEKPWENFIVQWLQVPMKSGIQKNILIIDTANYEDYSLFGEDGAKATLLPLGGTADVAHISELQKNILLAWASEMKDVNEPIIIVGHHPLEDYDDVSKKILSEIINKFPAGQIEYYLSGDTHDGYDVKHNAKTFGRKLREINLGSTIDGPLEYALAGVDTKTNAFETRRFFLTPGSHLKDHTYNYYKTYADIDPKFDECKEIVAKHLKVDTFKLDVEAPPYAPFGKEGDMPKQKRLWGYLGYAFTPYISFTNPQKVRDRNLYIYKINRFLDMMEVYGQVAKVSMIELENSKKLLSDVKKDSSFSSNFGLFHNDNAHAYIRQFSSELEKLKGKGDKELRLCSALFEAYREREHPSLLNIFGF